MATPEAAASSPGPRRLFVVKRPDGRPLWRVIYDHVEGLFNSGKIKMDDDIQHAELRALLHPDESISEYYLAVGRASKELRRQHKRSLRSRRGVGYTLIGGTAQVTQGDSHRIKAKRSMRRSTEIIATSDFKLMTSDERSIADKMQVAASLIARFMRMTAAKLAEHEDELNRLRKSEVTNDARHASTKVEIERIRGQLDQMKKKSGK